MTLLAGKQDTIPNGTYAPYIEINMVSEFGADPTGATSSSPAIAAALASIVATRYSKQPVTLVFDPPPVGGFYRLTATFDLTEKWNVDVRCPVRYFQQRQAVTDMETEYALFHWFGTAGLPMVLLDYSYTNRLVNVTCNGRNLAGVGIQVGKTVGGHSGIGSDNPTAQSNVKFLVGKNNDVRYCDVGIQVGDSSVNAADTFPIHFEDLFITKCKNQGLLVKSGNAGVVLSNPVFDGNGVTPAGGQRGCNVLLASGELFLDNYSGVGTAPAESDIIQESGGLRVKGAWSDVFHGPFLVGTGNTRVCSLVGVRHYNGAMTHTNTPDSIVYNGAAPLVVSGCDLYGDVVVNSGNAAHVIDVGTRFYPGATSTVAAASTGLVLPQAIIDVAAVPAAYQGAGGTAWVTSSLGPQLITYSGATATQLTGCTGGVGTLATGGLVVIPGSRFKGTAVDLGAYIGIGGSGGMDYGQNESRASFGQPHRNDVGGVQPFTVWSQSLRTGIIRSTTALAITEMINSGGSGTFYVMMNAWYDGTNWRAIKAGAVAMWTYQGGLSGYTEVAVAANAAAPGDIITFVPQTRVGAVGPSSQQGLLLYTDTNLYRKAVGVLATDHHFDISGASKVLRLQGVQVVGARGAAVADATDAASAITQLNALLARLRASTGHGLIA